MHFSYVCFHLLIIDSNCLLLKGGFRNLHVFFLIIILLNICLRFGVLLTIHSCTLFEKPTPNLFSVF
jgi:hypothetical protein